MSERGLEVALRALWGKPFQIAFGGGERSTFARLSLRLPAPARSNEAELDVARAIHASLHEVFSALPFELGELRPLQRALVGVLEDARIEALAMSQFRGLRRVWAPFHTASPLDGDSAPALLGRLARALFDSGYCDPNGWVQRARAAFSALSLAEEPRRLRELGSVLGNELGQMRLPFDPAAPSHEPLYRDDHQGLWRHEPEPAKASPEATEEARAEGTRTAGGSAGGDAGEHAVTRRYPEWDYVIARSRPDYCAVREQRRPLAVPVSVPVSVMRRVRGALRRAHEEHRVRRRCADGLELDLGAVVTEATRRARGGGGDDRLYVGRRRRRVACSTLLLLDLSASLPTAELRFLQSVSVTLSVGLPPWGELGIDGFCSRGREDVRYERFKSFDAPAVALAPERSVSGSTRLGAALRHATELLCERRGARKVLLLVTDGEPADVDVFDEQYLVEDARRAHAAARARGVRLVAWCLRRPAGPAARRIFAGNAVTLQRLNELPRHVTNAYSLRRSGRSGGP